jgi:hypothetical protein
MLAHGASGWLNLLMFVCVRLGFNMLRLGPIGIVLLLRIRAGSSHAAAR